MRRLLAVSAGAILVLAGPASADRVHTPRDGVLVGTPRADLIVGSSGPDRIQAAFGGRDTVQCRGGKDVVSADLRDRVGTACEVVSRRLSVDASTSPAGQHETAVEPDSFSWGTTVVAAFQLGRFAQGAAARIGTAVSTDAGRNWRRAVLPGLTAASQPPGAEQAASDPSVAYDAVHGVWLVGTLGVHRGGADVLVSRSPDGLAWSLPVTVASGPVLDKDWFACDNQPASPHRGRCYATYTDDAKNWTVVQWSDDGGATWSPPLQAASTLVGTQPVIRPDGGLVVVAGDYNGGRGLTGSIVSLLSTDGGESFTRWPVSDLHAHPTGPLRMIALPSVDVDPTGTLYAVWYDCRFRPDCSGNDLVLSTSDDGTQWAAPVRIPLRAQGARLDAMLPGLVADPAQAGELGLVYAYWRPGSCPRACRLEVAFVSSGDGGASWSTPTQLSAQPLEMPWLARTQGGRFVGDYVSTSVAGDRFVPVFTLATSPLRGRFREAIFAASLPIAPRVGG